MHRIQAQVVNSNSTSAVQDPHSGDELKLYLSCTGFKLRWWTQTLPRLYRIHTQVVNSNSTSAVQDSSSGGELKLCCTGSKLRWWTQTLPRLYKIHGDYQYLPRIPSRYLYFILLVSSTLSNILKKSTQDFCACFFKSKISFIFVKAE